jgi:hypothetical protein
VMTRKLTTTPSDTRASRSLPLRRVMSRSAPLKARDARTGLARASALTAGLSSLASGVSPQPPAAMTQASSADHLLLTWNNLAMVLSLVASVRQCRGLAGMLGDPGRACLVSVCTHREDAERGRGATARRG